MKTVCTLLIIAGLFAGCQNAKVAGLDDKHITKQPNWKGDEPPEIAEVPKKVLFDFSQPIYSFWTANDKIALSKVENTLTVDIKDAGRNYDCWGTQFEDLYDFSKKQVLKVTARMEGNLSPNLSIQLKDNEEVATNMNAPARRVANSPDFLEYYFNFEGRWKQIWPEKKDVDSKRIQEILFFVNPGKMNWTGKIIIDKIETLEVSEMPSKDDIRKKRREKMNKM